MALLLSQLEAAAALQTELKRVESYIEAFSEGVLDAGPGVQKSIVITINGFETEFTAEDIVGAAEFKRRRLIKELRLLGVRQDPKPKQAEA